MSTSKLSPAQSSVSATSSGGELQGRAVEGVRKPTSRRPITRLQQPEGPRSRQSVSGGSKKGVVTGRGMRPKLEVIDTRSSSLPGQRTKETPKTPSQEKSKT